MILCDIENYVINVEAVTFLELASDENAGGPATIVHFVGGESITVSGTPFDIGRFINPRRDNK